MNKITRIKEGAMRCSDTVIQRTPQWVNTEGLYMPSKLRAADMTYQQALRGLCAKSGGAVAVCRACPAPCPMGRQCIRLEDEGRTMEPVKIVSPAPVDPPPKAMQKAAFRVNLRKLLAEAGLSQHKFAAQIDVKPQTVSSWNVGNSFPTPALLERVCTALGVSREQILRGESA